MHHLEFQSGVTIRTPDPGFNFANKGKKCEKKKRKKKKEKKKDLILNLEGERRENLPI